MAKRVKKSARSKSRIRQMARQFPENGIRLLMEHPLNVRDLLCVLRDNVVERIDFTRLKSVKTTFVKRDYRRAESDIVLTAPLLSKTGKRLRREIVIYILIEHQSQPDRLMPLRVLDYVIQIFNYQIRQWTATHKSTSKLRLQPVLPVVFYTGSRNWNHVGRLVDLVESGELFERETPLMEPLFLNLPKVSAKRLTAQGGFFGWVLRLIQCQTDKPMQFKNLVEQAVRHLEQMPVDQQSRWLDLLSYIHALIYHQRSGVEQPRLQEVVQQSAHSAKHQEEILQMAQTYAEELRAEGREKGREEGQLAGLQRALLSQLRARFGKISKKIEHTITSTADIEQLDTWLARVLTAKKMSDMKIG